jgi:hypothetical protein
MDRQVDETPLVSEFISILQQERKAILGLNPFEISTERIQINERHVARRVKIVFQKAATIKK